MKKYNHLLPAMLLTLLLCNALSASARVWTLEDCIQYAMDNNISLQKSSLTRMSAVEDYEQSRAALLPSLNFASNQNVTYKPWQSSGTATVADGMVQASIDKAYYNGSYAVNANWTVWNGNRNRNLVKRNAIAEQQAELDSMTTALTLQEQIAKLYIQILYTKEAISVNKATLEAARVNENRGRQMYDVGTISKADLSQLTATRAQDEYNVVQAESQTRSYVRQLKQLLQITSEEEFDVAMSDDMTDAMALQPVPALSGVYEAAIAHRPEIRRAALEAESADIQRKLATAQRLPSLTMNAAMGTNSNTMSDKSWSNQMKTNFNLGGGFTISVPILDQRQTRTAVNKAMIQKQQALLDMRDKQTTLYSTIEDYCIQAGNYQNQYKAAKVSSQSAQDSYELLSEQFAVGLKNIVELQEGKTRLLSAKQSELQSKFMTILNIKMLEFYGK